MLRLRQIIKYFLKMARTPKTDNNDAGFLAVFIAYRSVLTNMLSKIVPAAEIEDIVQETFIRAHEAQTNKNLEHPKSFIYKTARNLALNFIARKEYGNTSDIDDVLNQNLDDLSVSDEFESKEKFRLFCAAVRELPLQCRKAFILKRVFGYSIKDISNKLGISPSTTEKHIAKGVLRCADYLQEKGYTVNRRVKHPSTKRAP